MSHRKPLLVAVPYFPFPVRAHGLSVRLAPIIERLSSERDVHILVVGESSAESHEAIAATQICCKSLTVIEPPPNRTGARLGLLAAMRFPPYPPLPILHPLAAQAVRSARDLIIKNACEAALFLGDTLSHVAISIDAENQRVRTVVDWVDSPTLHLERTLPRSEGKRNRAIDRMSRWERYINARVDGAIYISRTDAAFTSSADLPNVRIVPNGLVDDFPTDRETKWRQCLSNLPHVTLGFLGNMGYAANDIAARRLCSEMLPRAQTALTDLSLHVKIIGRNPSTELRAFGSPDVDITGAVDQIWSPAEAVDIFVFPMTQGAGMQNKLLEAMRSMRPVVASRLCLAGLARSEDSAVIPADTPDEVVAAVQRLVADPVCRLRHVRTNLEFLSHYGLDATVSRYIEHLASS